MFTVQGLEFLHYSKCYVATIVKFMGITGDSNVALFFMCFHP